MTVQKKAHWTNAAEYAVNMLNEKGWKAQTIYPNEGGVFVSIDCIPSKAVAAEKAIEKALTKASK